MIYLLDADIRGAESVQHLIDNGKVKHIPVPDTKAYDRAVRALIPKVTKDDLVILDTVSTLADTFRMNAKLGTDTDTDLWEKRHLYLGGDKNYLTVYTMAKDMILQGLKNLWRDGEAARIIVTAHESEQMDDLSATRKLAPALSPAFFDSLKGLATDIFRLGVLNADVLDDAGNIRYPAETRVLYLRRTEEFITKTRVPRTVADGLPKGIANPTLPKLFEVLHKKPSFLVLYAPPGAGKTTLACSEAEE